MGVWWQEVHVPVPEVKLHFAGDPSAISKAWPVLWRYGQDWHCLQVATDFEYGYRIYFATRTTQMSHKKLLTSRFVMVREGTEPVIFWAENYHGEHIELQKTGRMIPANQLRPDRSRSGASSLQTLETLGQIVYI